MAQKQNNNQVLLSTPLHGLYIPVGLILVGTAIIDYNYIPHAAGLALLLGGLKVWRGSKFPFSLLFTLPTRE